MNMGLTRDTLALKRYDWGGWEGGRCKREEKWEHIVYV